MIAEDKKPGFGGRQGPDGHEGKSSGSELGRDQNRVGEREKRRGVSNKTSDAKNSSRWGHEKG